MSRHTGSDPTVDLHRRRIQLRSTSLHACVLAAGLAAGCGPIGEDEPSAMVETREPTIAPFDVEAVVRSVHFSYRADGSSFVGGHDDYGVRVEQDGSLRVIPYKAALPPSDEPRGSGGAPTPQVDGAPLVLSTTGVFRGSRPVSEGARVALDHDSALVIHRGGCKEHLRNSADGVEQSWSFDRPPNGPGDISVRVRVSGEAYTGETEQGLHFADPETGLGVRYGLGTWIDATGRRTDIRPRLSDGEIVLVVPAQVVEQSTFPAVLDPTISPEQGMNSPIGSAAMLKQQSPAVAFDGQNYLVVWSDSRLGMFTYDVFGARVTPAGAVLDSGGIPIATDPDLSETDPAVAHNGTDFVVVWAASVTGTSDIFGARVDAGGAVLDATPFAVSTMAGSQTVPTIARAGDEVLVAWTDDRSGSNDVYATRVNPSAAILDGAAGLPIATGTYADQQKPAVASDGVSYLVVWQSLAFGPTQIVGRRVVPGTGALLGSFTVASGSASHDSPTVVFGGGYYLVAWTDGRNATKDVYAERVSPGGVPQEPTGTNFAVSTAAGDQKEPSASFDGTRYLVAWQDQRSGTSLDVYGARIATSGAMVDSAATGKPLAVASADQNAPAVAFAAGGNYLVAWTDARDAFSGLDVRAVRVAPASGNTSGNAFVASTAANWQTEPAVGYDGTNYLIVWSDSRGSVFTGFDIYGTRVSAAGAILDPNGIAFCTVAGTQGAPTVAARYDGSLYAVAWEDYRQGHSQARYTPWKSDGTQTPVDYKVGNDSISRDQLTLAAHGVFGSFLLAYRKDNDTSNIWATTLSLGNDQLDESWIASTPSDDFRPAVAYVHEYPDEWVIAWEASHPGTGRDIVASVGGGVPLIFGGIPTPIATWVGTEANSSVAFDGTNYLVVYESDATGAYHIYGQRFAIDAGPGSIELVGPQITISAGTSTQRYPAIAFGGGNYFVVWQDDRNGMGTDLYGAQVTPAGVVLQPDGIAISTEAGDESLPSVTHGGGNSFLVGYQRYDLSLGSMRVKSRLVTF